MLTEWLRFYSKVVDTIAEFQQPIGILFRGHANADWSLTPSLARRGEQALHAWGWPELRLLEENLYFEFITRAGDLLPVDRSSWDVVFAMQHHGIPTRLLDWSETFSVALHFALTNAVGDAAIWIMNPFWLNGEAIGRSQIMTASEITVDYEACFALGTTTFAPQAVAIYPPRRNPRVLRQRGAFTLHGNMDKGLDQLFPNAVRKVVLPKAAHDGARQFLELAGATEFSLFPDLDGLSRELVHRYFWKPSSA